MAQCISWNFNFNGYNHYTNDSTTNRSDGVVLFVAHHIRQNSIIKQFRKLNFVSITLELLENTKIKISGMYRCFDYDVTTFINNILNPK